jgi:hypothetical protein
MESLIKSCPGSRSMIGVRMNFVGLYHRAILSADPWPYDVPWGETRGRVRRRSSSSRACGSPLGIELAAPRRGHPVANTDTNHGLLPALLVNAAGKRD